MRFCHPERSRFSGSEEPALSAVEGISRLTSLMRKPKLHQCDFARLLDLDRAGHI
jgi:hypothetical protein